MMKRRWIALTLALALLLSGCGGARADTVSLRRTEGTVSLTNDGKSVTPRDGMKLYSGCELVTEAASYAWLDLDDAKLAKLDQESGVHIYKNGKWLEIEVSAGNLFFNVSRPLADDETMDIRTSTMMVGIRGTCGWVEAASPDLTRVYLLEGTVAVTAVDVGYEVQLSAGEVAEVRSANGDTSVSVRRFGAEEVPAFVTAELREDGRLALAIRDASGLDLLAPPPEDGADLGAYEQLLEGYRDACAAPSQDYLAGQVPFPGGISSPVLARYHTDRLAGAAGSVAYALFDIDGNGVEELLLLYNDIMLEIFGLNGSHPVQMIQVGEESCLSVRADGTILSTTTGVGSTDVGWIQLWQISEDGWHTQPVDNSWQFDFTGTNPGALTAEEYIRLMEEHPQADLQAEGVPVMTLNVG